LLFEFEVAMELMFSARHERFVSFLILGLWEPTNSSEAERAPASASSSMSMRRPMKSVQRAFKLHNAIVAFEVLVRTFKVLPTP
jgi:hypothetical protein